MTSLSLLMNATARCTGNNPPETILQYGKEGLIVFQSLSKRSNMTGWRVGYMAGDADIISIFLKAKENMDSGCATFVQKAAAAALSDEAHVQAMRLSEYDEKRQIMTGALKELGLPDGYADATFYIWQPVPPNMSSVDFATRLLEEDIALVVTPGPALAHTLPKRRKSRRRLRALCACADSGRDEKSGRAPDTRKKEDSCTSLKGGR